MNNEQIKQLQDLQKLSAIFTTKVLSEKEMGDLLQLIIGLLGKTKQDNNKLFKDITTALEKTKKELATKDELQKTSENLAQETKNELTSIQQELVSTMLKLEERIDVLLKTELDRESPDSLVSRVLSQIQLPEVKEVVLDDAKTIKNKLETLEGDERLDISAVKGLDLSIYATSETLNTAIGVLDSRTQFLTNRFPSQDGNGGKFLTTDGNTLSWASGGGGGGVSFGTEGQIPFVKTGDNDFDYYSGLFWDKTNQRLGVNKSNPGYTLDVAGNTQINGTLLIGGGQRIGTDLIQQRVGDLTLQTSSGSNKNIILNPDGTGKVKIGDYFLPKADGSADQVLKTDGSGAVSWGTPSGGGISLTDLSATSPISYNNTTGVFSLPKATTSQDGYLDKTDWVTFNGKQPSIITATSSTASTTAAKVATTAGGSYTPTAGDVLMVTFSNGFAVSTPTLNIDGSGAKNIRIGSSNVSTTFLSISAGTTFTLPLFYDGTYYQMYGSQLNTDTTYTGWGFSPTNSTSNTSAAINKAYVSNSASQLTFTLPATAAIGSVVGVIGGGTGGWKLQAPAGDNIIIEGTDTGAAGYLTGTQYGSVYVMCTVANTTWRVVDYVDTITDNNSNVFGLSTKENTVTASTTTQYYRGDKSWQTLDKSAVGLGSVDNTSDATKNSATATLTNKRIQKRVSSTTSVASITPDISSYDIYELTAQAVDFTLNLPSQDESGQTIVVRIVTASAKTLTINGSYKAENTLPTALASGKRYEFIINQFNTGGSKEYWITGVEF